MRMMSKPMSTTWPNISRKRAKLATGASVGVSHATLMAGTSSKTTDIIVRCASMPNINQYTEEIRCTSREHDPCTVLNNWYLTTRPLSPYSAPELGRSVLCGQAYSHPDYNDGESITTSRIHWIDMNCRTAKTHSRVYFLGTMQPAYRSFLLGHSSGEFSKVCASDSTDRCRVPMFFQSQT
jgi:hypothetical protein